MNKLWAPWRIGYIQAFGKQPKGCLFCRCLKSKGKNFIFIKNKYCFAMLNTFPYNNGHVMISPNRHVGDLQMLSESESTDIFKTLKQVFYLLDKILKPEGYNLGMNIGRCAGAGIPGHLHLHIVPRWQADTNFMPVVADSKVISQSLEELYRALKSNVKPKSNKRIRR
ncbi:MAG: HIT domain-containing protein [Candidatus Omnitrophota bacterium]|jgi:ATP adenylyltransferase